MNILATAYTCTEGVLGIEDHVTPMTIKPRSWTNTSIFLWIGVTPWEADLWHR